MPQSVSVYKNPDYFEQEPSSIHIVQQPRQIIRKQPENLDLSQARYEGRSLTIEGVNPYPDQSCSAKEFRQWIRDDFNWLKANYPSAFGYGNTCSKCGARDNQGRAVRIELHHVSPTIDDAIQDYPSRIDLNIVNNPNNLVRLCNLCHADWHHNFEPLWPKYRKRDQLIFQWESYLESKSNRFDDFIRNIPSSRKLRESFNDCVKEDVSEHLKTLESELREQLSKEKKDVKSQQSLIRKKTEDLEEQQKLIDSKKNELEYLKQQWETLLRTKRAASVTKMEILAPIQSEPSVRRHLKKGWYELRIAGKISMVKMRSLFR